MSNHMYKIVWHSLDRSASDISEMQIEYWPSSLQCGRMPVHKRRSRPAYNAGCWAFNLVGRHLRVVPQVCTSSILAISAWASQFATAPSRAIGGREMTPNPLREGGESHASQGHHRST